MSPANFTYMLHMQYRMHIDVHIQMYTVYSSSSWDQNGFLQLKHPPSISSRCFVRLPVPGDVMKLEDAAIGQGPRLPVPGGIKWIKTDVQ